VTCFKLTAKHAEWAGELWARRWFDVHAVKGLNGP